MKSLKPTGNYRQKAPLNDILNSMDYYTKMYTNLQAFFLLLLNCMFSITVTFTNKQIK